MVEQNGSSTTKPIENIKVVLSWDANTTASNFEESLTIPYTFLFHARELPSQFQLKNENDPRLHSKPFLRKATKWAIEKVHKDLELPIPEIDAQLLESGIGSMQAHLLLSIDSRYYKQAIDFEISHEVGHLYDNFYRPCPSTAHWKSKGIAALSLTLIGGASYIYGAEGTLMAGLFFVIEKVIEVKARFLLPHTSEKENVRKKSDLYLKEELADQLAIQAFPENAKGGIYLFQVITLLQKLNHPDLSSEELDPHHPTPAERIQFLRRHESHDGSHFSRTLRASGR